MMKKLFFITLLTFSTAMLCLPSRVFGQATLVYSENFISGGTPTTQCTNWVSYCNSLLSTYAYTSFRMSGSANPTGIVCTSPSITAAVAAALRTGGSYTATSDGYTWVVGTACGSGCGGSGIAMELTATGSTCACNTGYTVRPAINNSNWGGINGTTCSAGTQTMTVTFYYTPPFTATPSSLAFGGVTTSTYSSVLTTSMTVTGLTSGGSLTITPPSGFEVSQNGTTWFSTPMTYTYSGTSLTSAPLYVRFYPVTTTTYTGNITVSGGGMSTSPTIPVSGVGAAACSGTPTAGTANITPTTGGATTPFSLSLSGTSVAGGLTYQWQSSFSPTSGFTNITGATTSTYSFTGLAATTYYRALVTCPTYAAANSSTVSASPVATYTFTGSVQTYTVPCGVNSLLVDMQGGKGGNTGIARGGYGGRTVCSLAVTPGQVLNIYVGGAGGISTSTSSPGLAGFNGGGAGIQYAGGGGGASDIRIGGTALANRVVVAGGGGGGSANYGTTDIDKGGAGGGLIGENGYSGYSDGISKNTAGVGGFGGTQTTAGTGGLYPSYVAGGSGALGVGGSGVSGGGYGAGGGGGYYGGGAGCWSGGGGGSSYTDPTLTSAVLHTQGYNTTGDGVITLIGAGSGLIPSPGMLAFPYTIVGGPSAAMTTSLSAPVVTSGGSITITPPTGFQVSLNGTTWFSTPITYTYTGTAFSGTTLYVRFNPSALGPHTGTIDFSGGGLPPCSMNVSGTAVTPCSGTPTPGIAWITPPGGSSTTVFSANLFGTTVTGGLQYQWQSSITSPTSGFTNIAGATNPTYTFSGITTTTYLQAIVTCPTYAPAVSNTISATFIGAYTYTGTIGRYVVPAGVTSVNIITKGAQGGNGSGAGGLGANMSGNFAVTPGQVLKYLVGQQPAAGSSTGGGGGGSFVWDSLTNTLLIASGGGGGSGLNGTPAGRNATTDTNAVPGGQGGSGGGTAGNGGTAASIFYYAAGGAGWKSNGVNTNYTSCSFTATGGQRPLLGGAGGAFGGTSGSNGPGGFGGGGGSQGRCGAVGGGGGGGYSGGGPGGDDNAGSAFFPGGGGGSYNIGTSQSNSVGNTGNGAVTITPLGNCTVPYAQPTTMTFSSTLFAIGGSFSHAIPTPLGYLVVMRSTSTPPSNPTDGVMYALGDTSLGGVVVSNDNSTSFSVTGLTPGSPKYFWVFSYNGLCAGAPKYLTTAPLTGNTSTLNCSLSGVRTVGPTGNYPTIAAALVACSSLGVGGPLALELQTTYTGEAYPINLGSGYPCLSATNNITIRPAGTMTLTASVSGPLFSFNGAQFITIDGRVGSTGTTKALTIINTNTQYPAISLINDAMYDTVKYCIVRSSNISTATSSNQMGAILFGTTTGLFGNDNNTVDNCDITYNTSGGQLGTAVYSYGTSNKENSFNTISNCNIYDYYYTGYYNYGVWLNSYNNDWTISGNRFYQTASRSYTGCWYNGAIYISPGTTGQSSGFKILNNVIGYSSNTGSGTYTTTSSTCDYFRGIWTSVGIASPTVIYGNTISGLSINEANSATTSGGAITGIYHVGGSANIDSNLIGSVTGNGAITSTISSSGGTVVGISTSASSPTLLTPAIVNIRKNRIGGITVNGSSTTVPGAVHAIQASSTASIRITDNQIGSTTTANSIWAPTVNTSGAQYVYGINSQVTTTVVTPPVIANNTISNLTGAGTSTSNLVAGIVHASGSASVTVTGNTIYNITGSSGNTVNTTQHGVTGITCVPGSTAATAFIDSNTIYNIANLNTSSVQIHVSGILFSNASDATISRNKIYGINNASALNSPGAPPTANGLYIYSAGGSTTNVLSVVNNMITLGTGQTTNTSFTGIACYSSSSSPYRIYHNTVLIEGATASGTNHTTAFHRGGYNTTNTNTIDVRNNIFANNRTNTSGSAVHYAIANGVNYSVSSTGWSSDYNLLNSANAANVGWFAGSAKTFATWKTSAVADFNSGSGGALTFTNTAVGDLHINMGTTANMVESHGTNIPSVNADIENQVRPGPTGSVNGGGFAPDLGADEFDGNPLDNIPPAITYTPLLAACGTGDRTFTAVLADPAGVPISGALVPRVYYKKSSSGTWSSSPGALTSGTATNGVWTFTVVASDMGGLALGNNVQYFVLAQDNNGYVGSNTSGIQAGSVSSVSTYPVTPPNYNVLLNLGGSYDVGTGGAYTTITAAATAYNSACLSGPVTFNLISTTYPSETFPILLTGNSFASATNTLTIRPATATAVTINGPSSSANSIFKLQDAKWIILDGMRTGGASLTLNSTYTSTFANIWVSSTNAVISGCRNLTLRNMDIVGGTNTSTNYGILASYNNGGSATPTTSAGIDNDSITVSGNKIEKCYYGMYLSGNTAISLGGFDNWTISNNTFGPTTYSSTNAIYQYGIYMNNILTPQIVNNTFQNIGVSTASAQAVGIYMASNVNNALISGNTIQKIVTSICASTTSANCGIYVGSTVQNCTIVKNIITNIDNIYASSCGVTAGILLTTSQPVSNVLIANNMISDIKAKGSSGYSYFPAGIAIHNATGGIKIYHNSINLFGNYNGYNTSTGSAALLINSSANDIDVRNNIFRNTYDNTTTASDKGYAIYSTQTSGATFSGMNNNDYYVSGPNVLGYLSSDKTSLAQIQSSFGGNMNSIVSNPVMVDTVNLRLQVVPDNVPFLTGTPLSQVTRDIDDTLRSTVNPVIGAHEVKIPPCQSVVLSAGTPTPVTPVLCTQGVTSILPTGATSALNLTYQWLSSEDSTGWSPISGATSRSYSIATPITGSTWYRLRIGCSVNGMFDSATTRVIVNPSRIQGDSLVCEASSITLTDSTVGGAWSSASGLIASVVGTTGVVTGVGAGTVRITYTVGGCYATKNITVNPLPANIFGVPNVCEGATTTLVNVTGGGVWSSGTSSIASIAPSGVVSGIAAGISNITYQLPTTCLRQIAVSVNPVPVMSVSPSAAAVVCLGDTATFVAQATLPQFSLLAQNFNSGLGLWTTNLVSGPLTSKWRLISGGYNSTTGDGSQFLASTPEVEGGGNTIVTSPSFSTVGYGEATLTFNQDLVSISSDDITVQVQYSTDNGGSWTMLSDQMDVISETNSWTAASPQVSVAMPPAALNQANVKLRWVYNTTFGFYWAIDNIAVKAALPNPTYSWTAFAPATGLTCTGTACDTVKVVPPMAGVSLYSVTATTASGCVSTGGLTSVLVNTLPGDITGTMIVCEGASTTLADAAFGGSWSSSDVSKATVNISSGIVTGVAAGTAVITYAMPTGCRAIAVVTVNSAPAPVTGVKQVCTGFTTALATTSTDGVWSSSSSSIASISTSGVVTGEAQGTATISYTNLSNCYSTGIVTVNQYPAAITASAFDMCEGQTVNLSNTLLGGTWSSSNAAIASVTAGSGIVTGVASAGASTGIATISYTVPGCVRTQDVSVNPTPSAITGDMTICQSEVSTLSSTTVGGVWAISSASVASIDVVSGAVTGGAAGTTTVTYLMGTGCKTSAIVTVNQLPGLISGTLDVCQGLTTTLSNAVSGGAWISDDMSKAAISSTGVILGGAAGTANITYTLSTGCYRTDIATVNVMPTNISGAFELCQGSGTTLSSSPAGGTWTSSVASVATVDPTSGFVSASAINSGGAAITYALPTGCKVSENITVHQLPAAISGFMAVCETKTVTLSNSVAGGTWISADPAIADINSLGVVTGYATGNTEITYTMPTGCYRTSIMTVNTQPSAITGTSEICQGAGTALTSMPTGGVWISSIPGIASVDPVTGAVTASSINSGTAQVLYTLPAGCQTAKDITVDPLPAPITGTQVVCEGLTTNLASATSGGTWSASNTNVTIDAATGLVNGNTAGTTDIVYEFSTGCSRSAIVTVNQTPVAIVGAPDVCQTAVTTLTNTTPGGTWSVGSTYIATIDATTGELTGVNAGSTPVVYALPTGCNSTSNITVNQLPNLIAGTLRVCETQETTLSNTVGGGTWMSDDLSKASISSAGVVTGNAMGTANITYTLSTGCYRSAMATVNTLPAPISGIFAVCQGASTSLSSSPAGGSWTSSIAAVATIDPVTGLVTASTALSGISNIVYTTPEGCFAEANMLVNPLPAPIVGSATVCETTTTTLTNTSAGGAWSTDASGFVSVDATTGAVTGMVAGTAPVTYTLIATGCQRSTDMTVYATPAPITGTMAVCQGATTSLSTITSGGTWSSAIPSVATIASTGVVSGVIAGLTDVNYTLATGCKQSVTVSVNGLPTSYPVSGGGAYCAGGTGVNVGMTTSDADVHYQLYNGSATIGGVTTGTGTTLSFGLQTVPGTYTVTAINYATGCTKDMFGTATVSIIPTVIPSVTLSSSAGTSLCGGTASTYAATPVNGGTLPAYEWKVNGGVIPGATSASYSYTPANGDIVMVTLTSSAACADPVSTPDMLTMSVTTPVTPSATIAGAAKVCNGTPTLMTATPVNGGAAPSWQWFVNGSSISGATSSTYSFVPAAGDFVNCTMATSISCNTAPSVNSNTIALLTTPVIVPTVSITVSPGVVIMYGTPATFTAMATSAGAAPTYQWYKNGVSISGATLNSYTSSSIANADSITCRVTATEECGKETFNSVLMAVKGQPSSVAVSNMDNDIMLLPNPNTGDFVIKGRVAAGSDELINVEVTNILGQAVYTGTLPVKDGQINGHIKLNNDLANGMYLLNFKNLDVQKALRFVLER